MNSSEDLELLSALGETLEETPKKNLSAVQERVIAGFEEIQRWFEEHGRLPDDSPDQDIFERLYAVRLERIKQDADMRSWIADIDSHGLLDSAVAVAENLNDEELLTALTDSEDDITTLRNVRSAEARRELEDRTSRTRCEDFDRFKPAFQQIKQDLNSAVRTTLRYKDNTRINAGDWFIVDGLICFVAAEGREVVVDPDKRTKDKRLRVIFDNGTESNLKKRSLERALQKDKRGRRITSPDNGPLFSREVPDDEQPAGFVYVVRSKSNKPFIADNREFIHKIGVTTQPVERRLANAAKESTFLYSDVELVLSVVVFNIIPSRLEHLLHRYFDQVRLSIVAKGAIQDSSPREWFMVPLEAIEQALDALIEGRLTKTFFDTQTMTIKERVQ